MYYLHAVYTQLQKKIHNKYSKPMSCRTHTRVRAHQNQVHTIDYTFWVLTGKQSVYFLLDQGVIETSFLEVKMQGSDPLW